MLDFQVPRISSESVDDNRGSFTIEPLDRGFGYTFGNSLRRVLLSSLAGAAVTSVRIEGVDLRNLHKAALDVSAGGVGYYPVSNFVHVDVARVRQWTGA